MTIEIPWNRLIENSHDWNLVGTVTSAGQTNGMSVDVRSDGGGLWLAKLNNIRFNNRLDGLLWRAIRQIANGGATPLIVYRRDTTWAPFPTDPLSPITHSDDTYFDDGSGYYQPVIDVTCNDGAALRATSMVVNLINCAPLQGGESFSINHPTFGWRLYEIATANDNVITFNPPLREAVINGERLEFDRPRCLMKLAGSTSMDLNNTTYPFSLASATFVESKYAT